MRIRKRGGGLWLVVVLFIAVIFGLNGLYAYGTARTMTVEVTDKERVVNSTGEYVNSYWLVFTREHDVLRNEDNWMYLKFNSSSIQGKLERGKKYTVKVYGWRVGFFSMYPNIVKIINN